MINNLILSTVLIIFLSHSIYAQSQKPNIVFIMADDLGIGDLGVYGQTKIKTPNLDKLAKDGAKFTQFYAGTSVCAPSRASLMTGMHTGHTYVRGNKEIEPEGQEPLTDSIRTFAMDLQQAGYATGAFGKWGLGMVGTSGDPNLKGFDTFYGYNCQRQSHRYYPTHLWHNKKRIVLNGNDLTNKVHYAPTLIQEQILQFIEDNKEKPFFLFVPTVLPHAELVGPEDEYYKMYENAFPEKAHQGEDYGPNATVGGYASVEKPRATFAAMVTRMDAYVGQIIAKLDELGLRENTIILFTSDNGAHREGGADPDFFNSTAGFKGVKRSLHEGGIRTPLIINWKNKIAPNQHISHIAAFWDVYNTLVELGKTSPSVRNDGISFLPTLLKQGTQKEHKYLYWEFHEDGGRQAVLADGWKLIKQKVKTPKDSYYELYHIDKDPYEKNNLADSNPIKVKELSKLIEQAHIESTIYPLIGLVN
ncbi:arylsulfatase A-like enzyme [Sphingobacterium alimentarium]|uniref:Arylsulfatase A-like enzyme n=1 Tax=Sphingobacterium alimentarium TaxID=797292 RepID=A0A4R3VUI5_9SPHI|nr:arylsulfatase [Sphingobacterium alimentarium]TCV09941.1 arylsulfatase A-like enzyme [Sphingobacterium alimentarium]